MRCTLCPRRCDALRTEERGEGFCRMPAAPVAARAALHLWEEPPISGQNGSGTVFFSGCTLRCVYCQNMEISRAPFGKALTLAQLHAACMALCAQGAHNINFVNPTHYAHVIARLAPLPVPVVWNSGGYDRVDTLRTLEGRVDVYLPDLKYLDADGAARYSGAADYPEVAVRAITEMYRQTGPAVVEDGLLRRGVLIRHLLLPGRLAQGKAVMDWVAAQFPPGAVLFSLLGQYTPWGDLSAHPELTRTLRPSELRAAAAYMENLGLRGFTQDGSSARHDYTPAFDLCGL